MLFDAVNEELSALEAYWARRDAADSMVNQLSVDDAQRAVSIGDFYRWLPPAAAIGLASMGYDHQDPRVYDLATKWLSGQARSPFALTPPGTEVTADQIVAKTRKPSRLEQQLINQGIDVDLSGGGRGGFGTVGKRLLGGVKDAAKGLNPSNPMTIVKGASRALDVAGRFPAQYAQASYRTGVRNVQEHGIAGGLARSTFQNALEIGLQTDLGAATAQLASTGKVDTGSGFFANDRKGVGQIRHAAELAYGATITYPDGTEHAATIGRDLARTVGFEPGTKPFNILSGFGDAAVQIGGMALGNAGGAETRAAEGFKTLQIARVGEEASPVERTLDTIGAILRPGARATYDRPTAVRWLDSSDGQSVAEWVAKTKSTRELDKVTGGKLPTETLRALEEADTPQLAKKVMLESIDAGDLRNEINVVAGQVAPWKRLGIELSDRLPRVGRAGNLVPRGAIALDDSRQGLTELDTWMSTLLSPNELRDAAHARWVNIPDQLPESVVYPLRKGADPFAAEKMVPNPLAQAARRRVVIDVLDDAAGRIAGDTSGLQAKIDDLRGLPSRTLEQTRELDRLNEDLAARTKTIRSLFKLGSDTTDADIMYWLDEANRPSGYFGTVVDGGGTVVQPARAKPSLIAETIGPSIAMPNARDIREATANPLVSAIMKTPGLRQSVHGLEWAQGHIWMPARLLRIATSARIIGDEQARLAAERMPGLLNHPLQAIAWAIADPNLEQRGVLGKVLAKLPGEGRGGSDVLGREMAMLDDFRGALNRSDTALWRDIQYKRFEGYQPVRYGQRGANGEDLFHPAWHGNLGVLHVDPVTQMIANADSLEHAQDVFWTQMRPLREQWADLNPRSVSNPLARSGEDLLSREGADAYVRLMSERLHDVTQGDPRLLNAVRYGEIKVTDPKILAKMRDAGIEGDALRMYEGQQANSLFTEALEAQFGDTAQGFRDHAIVGRRDTVSEVTRNRYDKMVTRMFGSLLGNPDDILSRSPAVRQYYWQNAREFAPRLDPAERDAFLRNAEAANLKGDELKTLRAAAGSAPGDNPLSLEELHHLSVAHSVDDTTELLYDLNKRHQWADMLKIVAPFGEAWGEIIKVWGGLLAGNPDIPSKLSVLFRGVRSEEFGDVAGAPEGKGFFYADENGNEVFAYPLTAHMTGMLTGVPIPLVGRVKGLSIGTEVLPGIGPVMAMPVAAAIDHFDNPRYDGLRKILFPYGTPQGSLINQAEQQLIPTWAQSVANINGGMDQRAWMSQLNDVMRYNASTGEYDLSGPNADPAEINRALEASKSDSRWLSLIRAAGRFVAPSAPAYEWAIEDKSGQRLSTLTLARELHDLRSDPDPQVRENAVLTFLQRHGQGAFALLQGKTVAVSPAAGLPPTKEAGAWLQQHKGIDSKYAYAFGFFAPHTPGADFDPETYRRIMDSGQRTPVPADVAIKAANAQVAKAVYYSIRNKFGSSLTAEASLKLYDLRQELEKRYPGYSANGDDVPGLPTKASRTQIIDQLEQAANDTALADNPLTKPLKGYLDLRKKAEAASRQATGRNESWATSAGAAALRRTMYDVGSKLAAASPEFQSVWESVLLNEFDSAMVDDGLKGR